MDQEPEEMDYRPDVKSPFLATLKGALSPQALSTLRVMAFLYFKHLHKNIFGSLRHLFLAKNEELMFNFPTTDVAYNEACAELMAASLIQLNEEDKAFSMRPEIQTSVLADMQPTGLIAPLFNAMVKVLTGLWPRMISVPDRTVNQEEFTLATTPGTDFEAYLKTRYSEGRIPVLQEYVEYARVNVWGRRDELVAHVARLEHIFYHLDDDMVEVCATVTFAMLLAEAAWYVISSAHDGQGDALTPSRYYLERSKCEDAEAKIQAAFGVCGLARAKSSLHHASIRRVHAAIALERGRADEAAQFVNLQLEQLDLHYTEQGEALKKSGLLDRAPDAVAQTPWGLEVPPGYFLVLPFRSVCSFGWKLYLSAQDEKDPKYAQCLYQAQLCFSTALKDHESAHNGTGQMYSRLVLPCTTSRKKPSSLTLTSMGELLYGLGNVTTKQAIFLGKAHLNESLEFYEKALLHFEGAVRVNHDSMAGIAKTHYKLVVHNIRNRFYRLAKYENRHDVFRDLLMRTTVSTSTRLCRFIPATLLTTLTSLASFSNRAEFRH